MKNIIIQYQKALVVPFIAFASALSACNKQEPEPNPTVTAVEPAIAAEGMTVTVTGCNFSAVPSRNEVTFNGFPGTILSASSSALSVVVPANAFTTAEVPAAEVFVKTGTRSCSRAVLLKSPLYPQIVSVAPASSRAGDVINISGQGFKANPAESAVLFPGANNTVIQASIRAASSSSLQVIVPAGAISGNARLITYFNTTNTKSVTEIFPVTINP
ncbi:IPT/TIG domain-containing protein [Hymenobacter saemangeumensis]|uniref:IPT/TIG domain-containing protein n=1 Tax=Hymenobacter saemangeumensis TaxID=1084522 RepID=UPI0031E6B12C